MIRKILIFIVVLWLCAKIGGAIAFGIMTFVGMVAIIESIPFLKWIVKKTTSLIDVLLFGLTVYATTQYGYNITASLTMAGLGYTLVYAPYVRRSARSKVNKGNSKTYSDIDWS